MVRHFGDKWSSLFHPGEVRTNAWFLRCHIISSGEASRMNKTISQMRDMLKEDFLVTQSDVIDQDQVLMDLPHVTYMGNHADIVFPG